MGDLRKDRVAGQEYGIEVEGALGDVGVGESDVHASSAKLAAKLAHVEPVAQRR